MELEGSCHCGGVHFTLRTAYPYPFNYCYCSICRKTAGGGGYAINLGGDYSTLQIHGEENLMTLDNFASLSRDLGEWDEARRMFREAERVLTKSLGDHHPRLARCLEHAALLHLRTGELAEASRTAIRSERIGRHVLRLTAGGLSWELRRRTAPSAKSGISCTESRHTTG